MRVLIDGVFFQLASSGIARVWKSVLSLVAGNREIELFLLDRGSAPLIPNCKYIPFPSYDLSRSTAADSIAIQSICDWYKIDVFSSTYYTTPLAVPTVLVIYDMIPELFGFDLAERAWQEKRLAINFAHRTICISDNTRRDLIKLFPSVNKNSVSWCHLAVDRKIFFPHAAGDVAVFQKYLDVRLPYYLFVGSRDQHNSYKNSAIFFEAVGKLESFDFEVICVGGEGSFAQNVTSLQDRGLRVRRFELSDAELALIYSGAIALVYPSLYEGFGLPVLEAMASGCPVITTRLGSLAEVAGSAALFIDGKDAGQLIYVLAQVRDSKVREVLRSLGLKQAERFDWDNFARHFALCLQDVFHDHKEAPRSAFFQQWERLRKLQRDCDFM